MSYKKINTQHKNELLKYINIVKVFCFNSQRTQKMKKAYEMLVEIEKILDSELEQL